MGPGTGRVLDKTIFVIFIALHIIDVFVNNTNLTFLSFLYKISIGVSLKNKVASSGI